MFDCEGGEWGSGGEDDGSFGPGDGLFEGTFGLCKRVAEREEDGSSAQTTSLDGYLESSDDGLGEDAKGRGQTDQSGGLDVFNDLFQSRKLMTVVIRSGEDLLVFCQFVSAVLGHETLGIDEPELVASGLFGKSATGVVFHDLLGNTDTS